jgi:hypothetical protein
MAFLGATWVNLFGRSLDGKHYLYPLGKVNQLIVLRGSTFPKRNFIWGALVGLLEEKEGNVLVGRN